MQQFQQKMVELLGDEQVISDPAAMAMFSEDVYSRGALAGVVVQPGNTGQLAAVVAAAVESGHAVVSRGGGMSYTGGYTPAEERSVLIDMTRMSRILEINTEDMYVTVEAGATWAALHEALEPLGVRTPYWGTLSGLYATVGGGLSQNSIFWGSGRYGSAVDSVLGLAVVLADGTVLQTGSAAQINASPFFRHFGPDITGLFTADCGALGIKATATLRLMPSRPARAGTSFAFDDYNSMIAAMSEIGRQDIVTECFGFDPYLQKQRMKRESLASDVKKFAGVLKASSGVTQAIRTGARMAASGRRFMDDVQWSFHVMTEDRNQPAADACIEQARAIAKSKGGRELPDSIPKLIRANPFGPVNNMLGAEGERWAPVHALVPHSQAAEVMDRVENLFNSHRNEMDELEVNSAYLLTLISTHCFVIEPVFFWPDELFDMHRHFVEDKHLERLPSNSPNPQARELVAKLRAQLIALFRDVGAVHLQVSKSYEYAGGIKPDTFALVQRLKKSLDPSGRINPGNLGL